MILDMLKYDTEDKCAAEKLNKISPGVAPRPWAHFASWHRQIEAHVIISTATFLDSTDEAIPDCSEAQHNISFVPYRQTGLTHVAYLFLNSIVFCAQQQDEPPSPALPLHLSSTNLQCPPP